METTASTIFVQIASYRDPELLKTIQSCLANAHFPENLRFGICWQYDTQTIHDMDAFNHDKRFRIDKINYQDSKGCCWARNRVNRLYKGETYTLQIDAHMRFAPDWDSLLMDMIEGIRDSKPLITTYPPSYSIVNGEEVLSDVTSLQMLKLKRLHLDLTTQLEGVAVTDSNQPGKSQYIAAGYFFTLGQFCKEVEYDPNLYFLGEEINLAVRAYSNGYNFYYPNKNLVWHLYSHGASLHWSDHPEQEHIQHAAAIDRLEKLLLHDSNDLGQYGLGKERTLKDYEQYANICFSEVLERRKLAKPEIPFRHRIRLNTSGIEVRNDYHYWVFCLLNEEDIEIYRRDITDPDVLNHRVNEIAVNTLLPSMPTQYKLWPKHREWGPELIYPLYFLTDTSKTTEIDKLPVQPRVFVALAAYCEAELRLTIQNCLNRAQFPERVTFGICLQYDDDGPPEIQRTCLDDYENDERFRIVKYPYQDSQGGCWARNIVQSLYRDEEYTLQVDSHTRFLANWDIALINMMQVFPSAKPLITGFPPLYFYENEKENLINFYHLERVPTTLVESWSEDGWVYHPTRYLPQNTKTPRRCRILSGAFVFTLGRWNYEVNQDPYHLYTGEEFALTLRSYTHGYDLFNPSHIVVWHRCHPQPNRKYIHNFDKEAVLAQHNLAIERLQILLSGDTGQLLGLFGLGSKRTLQQYSLFSGLDFETRTIHADAIHGVPPDPITVLSDKRAEAEIQEQEIIDVSIHLKDAKPVLIRCAENSPVLEDLYEALRINANPDLNQTDRLIYLSFDDEGHELYFLQSQLQFIETRTIG